MRRWGVALLAAVIAVGVVALPAAAIDEGVGVFAGGIAEVGDEFVGGNGACTKDVAPPVFGMGLPVPGQPKVADLDHKYRLRIPDPFGPPPQFFVAVIRDQDNDQVKVVNAELVLCGSITAVGGQPPFAKLGPWCGMNKGYNGKGKLRFTDPLTGDVDWANLSDVGWKFTIGPVLPILGKIRGQLTNPDDTKGPKKDKWGTLIGALAVRSTPFDGQSGQSCANTVTGGTVFRVDGVATILNWGGGKEDVYTWQDFPDGDADRRDSPIFCKGKYDSDQDGAKDRRCPIYQEKPKPTKPKDN